MGVILPKKGGNLWYIKLFVGWASDIVVEGKDL